MSRRVHADAGEEDAATTIEAKAAKHDELEARIAQLEAKASDEAKAPES